jgi:Cof subfamily protein (haloacid dehalogenase superfamily)
MIQLIATDIDGTLLDHERFISNKTSTVFAQIDLPKILISARMPQAMHYLQDALKISDAPMICYNGALVLHGAEVIHSQTIDYQVIEELAKIGRMHNLHVSIYRNDEWYVTKMDQWASREVHNTRTQPTVQDLSATLAYFQETQELGGAHKVMFMGDEDGMDSAFAKAEQQLSSQVHLYRSKTTYTEISPMGISKRSALELLLRSRFPHITMNDVVAFGDNYNDTDLLQGVGHGVAVFNAREEVKAAAAYTTGHHKDDGVAIWLEDYLIKKAAR